MLTEAKAQCIVPTVLKKEILFTKEIMFPNFKITASKK
jgi:hypothetical protein